MLTWQSVVFVAGSQWSCLESYDSIHERLRDGAILQTENEGLQLLPPLELTFKTGDDKVLRALVPPHSIAMVLDIPVGDREPVEDVG